MENTKRLAEALVRVSYNHDVTYGMNAYNECRLCGQSVLWSTDESEIEHDSECPIVLARQILSE